MTRRPVILAVDDTPGNLVALEAVLDRDFEVRVARNGAEAIAELQHHSDVDVIVMDVNMPVMDGYEAASRITRIPGCADLPIVFVTATYKEDPHVRRGYEVGGIDYFTKPFDPDLLRKKIGVYASFRHAKAAENLLATTKRLALELQGAAVGVLIRDAAGELQHCSDAAAKILGGSAHAELAAWCAGNAGGIQGTAVTRVRCIDGVTRDLHCSVSPLRDSSGAIAGSILALIDLTEATKLERELEKTSAHVIARRRPPG